MFSVTVNLTAEHGDSVKRCTPLTDLPTAIPRTSSFLRAILSMQRKRLNKTPSRDMDTKESTLESEMLRPRIPTVLIQHIQKDVKNKRKLNLS